MQKQIVDPTGKFLKLYVFNLRREDRRARVNVNATMSTKKKAVFENPNKAAVEAAGTVWATRQPSPLIL